MSTKEFASKLVREAVAIKSYSLWKDSQFRKMINFAKLANKQQDKIFNDLQVTALLYALLFLEEKAAKKEGTYGVVYANIGEYTTGAFLTMMQGVELTDKQVDLWRELVNLREKEYKKDLSYIMKESKKWDVFEGEDKLLRETWGRVVTLSLGTLKHIKKGYKYSAKDPLWGVIRRWLVSIEVELIQTFKDTDMRDLKVLN